MEKYPMRSLLFSCLITCLIIGCSRKHSEEVSKTLFTALTSDQSGITFENRIRETEELNYFTHPHILYLGAGVAIGDINNDGLEDIFFAGNMNNSSLYLNQGGLEFKDISSTAGVTAEGDWVTGVTMVDINNDQFLDLYLSVNGHGENRTNKLYVNNGDLTFSEEAAGYGIDDNGAAIQSVFFDYDQDGDNDLLVINYPKMSFITTDVEYKVREDNHEYSESDKLYRNLGNGKFEDVTMEAGLRNFGLSLSASVTDFNQDSYPDIYISNDFSTPDRFFLNQGDGTFKNTLDPSFRHTAYFGMGSDMADLNNDGLPDLVQMEMTPADNYRSKANMASMNPEGFAQRVALGFHNQYMQNAVQLNQGNIPGTEVPVFGDIGRLTGAATTDWSWSPLLADYDNDGNKDMFITNGIRREVNNKDFLIALSAEGYFSQDKMPGRSLMEQLESMPSVKIANYAFQNHGNLNFEEKSQDWGLDMVGFSNGAAYGDLDNDGDLDLVVSNIDSTAMVFRNNLKTGNYLKVRLVGPEINPNGVGCRVSLQTADNNFQVVEQQLTRGYLSSVSPVIHFGLGENKVISELTVKWPDGNVQQLNNVNSNQTLELDYKSSVTGDKAAPVGPSAIFHEIDFKGTHQEDIYDDYRYQVLLPHKLSQLGPAVATGDINGDGNDDLYLGGSAGYPGTLFIQTKTKFKFTTHDPFVIHQNSEDTGALFFDADGDNDLDLYVVSGSNEKEEESEYYRDRLYINDGAGNFSYDPKALPDLRLSGQEVSTCDFDNDGDLDLFVGGRQIPRKWPEPASSILLLNETKAGKVRFIDATANKAPGLLNIGLVTTSIWTDIEGDGDSDLVLAGEWMPLTVFRNENSILLKDHSFFTASTGWWYRLQMADIDNDGDQDIIAGNLGLNYKYQASEEEPFEVYAGFMDQNRIYDVVLSYYQEGQQYPVRGRQCSSQQMPGIKYKFPTYDQFAQSTLQEIYEPDMLEMANHFSVKSFASGIYVNQGNGSYQFEAFNNQAQVSSIHGILVDDFNEDGKQDILTAGNLYVSEVETTRNDASVGLLLSGTQEGFKPVSLAQSGFYAPGDVKNLVVAKNTDGEKFVVVANNNDKVQVFQYNF